MGRTIRAVQTFIRFVQGSQIAIGGDSVMKYALM